MDICNHKCAVHENSNCIAQTFVSSIYWYIPLRRNKVNHTVVDIYSFRGIKLIKLEHTLNSLIVVVSTFIYTEKWQIALFSNKN